MWVSFCTKEVEDVNTEVGNFTTGHYMFLPVHKQLDYTILPVRQPVSYTHLDVYKRQSLQYAMYVLTTLANSTKKQKSIYINGDLTQS